jgi:hypothetical protein
VVSLWDEFILPHPGLYVISAPTVYLMALLMKYEDIFVRIDILNKDPEVARYAKRKIFTSFHVNLRKLNRWSKEVRMIRVSNRADVLALIQNSKSK